MIFGHRSLVIAARGSRYASHTRHFQDDEKNQECHRFAEPQHAQKLTIGVDEFSDCLQCTSAAGCDDGEDGSRGGGGRGGGDGSVSSPGHLDLQTALMEGVGEDLKSDFHSFDWEWLLSIQRRLGWGELTSNLLFVGKVHFGYASVPAAAALRALLLCASTRTRDFVDAAHPPCSEGTRPRFITTSSRTLLHSSSARRGSSSTRPTTSAACTRSLCIIHAIASRKSIHTRPILRASRDLRRQSRSRRV